MSIPKSYTTPKKKKKYIYKYDKPYDVIKTEK